ncbi:MAG: hypothetical protein AAB589_03230 [Patescibacteria group bacterium]
MKKLKFILITTNILASLGYLFLLNQVVLNLANRDKFDHQSSNLATEVAELETKYADLAGKLTLDHAYQLGFVDTAGQTLFATRLGRPILVSYGQNGN